MNPPTDPTDKRATLGMFTKLNCTSDKNWFTFREVYVHDFGLQSSPHASDRKVRKVLMLILQYTSRDTSLAKFGLLMSIFSMCLHVLNVDKT